MQAAALVPSITGSPVASAGDQRPHLLHRGPAEPDRALETAPLARDISPPTASRDNDTETTNMIETLQSDDSSDVIASVAANVSRKASLLSLAGDAICMAMTALRLSTPSPADEREVTLDQVSWHDQLGDCWIVVYDRVYDVTKFLHEHPGGEEILLEYAGRDATMAFRSIGHSAEMLESLEPSLVGVLPQCERIYSCLGGKLAGLL